MIYMKIKTGVSEGLWAQIGSWDMVLYCHLHEDLLWKSPESPDISGVQNYKSWCLVAKQEIRKTEIEWA